MNVTSYIPKSTGFKTRKLNAEHFSCINDESKPHFITDFDWEMLSCRWYIIFYVHTIPNHELKLPLFYWIHMIPFKQSRERDYLVSNIHHNLENVREFERFFPFCYPANAIYCHTNLAILTIMPKSIITIINNNYHNRYFGINRKYLWNLEKLRFIFTKLI